MNSIMATWKNGKIVPSEPVDWPEGSRLIVEPIAPSEETIGMSEDWKDDPASIADWIAWVDTIQPMIWEAGEREEFERYRAEHRRFNIDAVRKQMGLEDKP